MKNTTLAKLVAELKVALDTGDTSAVTKLREELSLVGLKSACELPVPIRRPGSDADRPKK